MSDQAIKFKKNNPNINYKNLSLAELNKLPAHVGIVNFKISRTSFNILNILNDDSSAVKFFWKDSHDISSLDIWFDLSTEEGLYIDVGAHTGLYTLTCLKANKLNQVIAFEPYYLNMARLLTNLRLNTITSNVETKMDAVSIFNGISNFKISTEKSYLSKGGKISKDGKQLNTLKLDSLDLNRYNKPIKGIKIDTEGEDLNVLFGSEQIIKKYMPKIIIEVREENKKNIQDFFSKHNYKLFNVLDKNKEINLLNNKIENVSNIYAEPI